jgi:hypothetical protein
MSRYNLVYALLSLPLGLADASSCYGPRTPGQLRNQLWGPDSDYEKNTRPEVARLALNESANPGDAAPDVAKVQLHVNALTFLNQKRNEYQINVWFRQRWNDFRLQYNDTTNGGCFPDNQREGFREELLNEIWHPDFFIENQVKVDSHVAGSFWVYPNGDVAYVKSELLTLSCNMDFNRFPKDVQVCSFRIGTFLEDATDVLLEFWDNIPEITLASNKIKDNPSDAATAHGGTTDFEIIGAYGNRPDADEGFGTTQTESYVYFTFELERNADYYKDFVIMPSILMVFIGWASFFISREAAPARVTMSMICFLANANYLSAQLANLPRLGNDIWLLRFMTISQLFTFYAVIEYVVCNYLLRVEKRVAGGVKRAEELKSLKKESSSEDMTGTVQHQGSNESFSSCEDSETVTKADLIAAGFDYKVDLLVLKNDGTMRFRDQHVDITSRYIYPLVYIVSCCIIWGTLGDDE